MVWMCIYTPMSRLARTSSLSKFPTPQARELWTSGVMNQVPKMSSWNGGNNMWFSRVFCSEIMPFFPPVLGNAFSKETGISMCLLGDCFQLRGSWGPQTLAFPLLFLWQRRQERGMVSTVPLVTSTCLCAFASICLLSNTHVVWWGCSYVEQHPLVALFLDEPNSGLCEFCVCQLSHLGQEKRQTRCLKHHRI